MGSKVQVLVIGAGPVGMTAAAELARYGTDVRIVERSAARTDKSKALVLWPRTLELLDRAGATGAFLASGMPAVRGRIVAGGRELGRIGFEAVESPYRYALMIPQSETERLLEAHLASLGIRVERQVELTAFTAAAEGVTATLAAVDGSRETVEADWLVGCDGAHSTVRHGLGVDFAGHAQPSDWILADVHIEGDTVCGDEVATYMQPDGVLVFFPIAPGRFRIVAELGPAQGEGKRPDPTMGEVQAVLDRRGPGGLTVFDPVWLSCFRINERKVDHYRHGRVFLAGDAAHIHSPAGGQGMNTGMQDAFNLAWKLSAVCHGLARPSLLDSYDSERSAVGDRVLRNAARLTDVAILRNPVAQAVRNVVARFVLGLGQVQHRISDQFTELDIAYPDGPLSVAASGAPRGGDRPRPGERLVLPRPGETPIGAGNRPLFAVLATGQGPTPLAGRFPALVEAERRAPPEPDGLWLIRPDGYVGLAAARDDWAAAERYLAAIAA
jgi:2-polyprenyl-6-methoxyphenol hydroxylase-like FAD-dependent oxidoreductase